MSAADLRIRRARPGDRHLLLELWDRSVRATHHFLSDSDVTGLRPFVAEELADDAIEWWVATLDDDRLAGFLGYTPGVIDGLFIDPAFRGLGAGTLLIAHGQELAQGPLRVDVNEENSAARGFYESLGFTVVGRSPLDGAGRPFPLLHMARQSAANDDAPLHLRVK
jgi:putative acetyltransferase